MARALKSQDAVELTLHSSSASAACCRQHLGPPRPCLSTPRAARLFSCERQGWVRLRARGNCRRPSPSSPVPWDSAVVSFSVSGTLARGALLFPFAALYYCSARVLG